jgi:hypothetical protein
MPYLWLAIFTYAEIVFYVGILWIPRHCLCASHVGKWAKGSKHVE